jgi:N-acetyl-1-D-myo-inositol-2-amino-2-deoxy-alpha-D-glucopyranoside deacetylase
VTSVDDLPFGTPDEKIAARVSGAAYADQKLAALRAHATQIPANSWLFVMATNFGDEFMGYEHFMLVHGERGPGDGPYGWESDLFAGLDVAGLDVAGPTAAGPAGAGSGAAGPDVTG